MCFKRMFMLNRLDKLTGKKKPKLERKYDEINRRAIAMLPGTGFWNGSENELSQASKLRQLLLSIEANELSYCIKISSPKRKSRGAAVIFRGRVVGCIYGQKRMQKQAFGKQAYQLMLSDVCCPSVIIKTDQLKEDFALAASSLFSGDILQVGADTSPQETFELAHAKLEHSALPGCIVVRNKDEMFSAIIYMFNGRIIGIFSYKENEGWVANSYDKAQQLISKIQGARISTAILSAQNVGEVLASSFAMSSLSEVKETELEPFSKFELAYALVTNYDQEKINRANLPTFLLSNQNPFMPKTINSRGYHGSSVYLD